MLIVGKNQMNENELRQAVNKRIKRGSGIAGPEYHGCFNTGRRPVILHNPYKQASSFWLVGTELSIDELKMRIAIDDISNCRQYQYGEGKNSVFTFKTKTNAVEKWIELCKEVIKFNENEIKIVSELKQKAKSGDMKAILDLQDH